LGAIIIAVGHKEYRKKEFREFADRLSPKGCLVDVKCILDPYEASKRDILFWRL